MSDLREQIQQAKRDHERGRYPGDLAADVLGAQSMRIGYATPERRTWLFWANVGALGAVAATVAIVMWRVQPSMTTTSDPAPMVATNDAPPDEEDFTIVPELAGGTIVPQGMSVVPSFSDTTASVPAMPSFPSMADVLDSAESTTNTNSEERT